MSHLLAPIVPHSVDQDGYTLDILRIRAYSLSMKTKQADAIAKTLFGQSAYAESHRGYRDIGIRVGMSFTILARVCAPFTKRDWANAICAARKNFQASKTQARLESCDAREAGGPPLRV